MQQQHRKLIKIVEITDQNYVKVPQIAQTEIPFNTKSKPTIIEQPQQSDFTNYIKGKLDKLKQYLQPPHKKYEINYGVLDDEKDKCPFHNQFQQNLNDNNQKPNRIISKNTKNILPSLNPYGNESSLHFKERLNLSVFNERVTKHFQTYKQNDQQKPEQYKREFIQTYPKMMCKCKKCDIILDTTNNNQKVMILQKFTIKILEGDQMITRRTIQYEKDLFKLEELKEDEDEQNKKFKKQVNFPFVKLNQSIGKREEYLFKNTGQYWTSSMIDGYGNYLSGLDEQYYFSLSSAEREQYPRLFIFTSDFLTNCNLESPPLKEKWLSLMLEKLEIFKTIQYQFWIIYQKIAFIVNKSNSHWYMLTLDLKERYIVIYDSLSGSSQHYNKVRALLSYVFYELQKNELKNIREDQYEFKIYYRPKFQSQNDSYSCGYHTCIALQYFSNTHRVKGFKDRNEIKNDLNKILLYEPI
ncbi:unnamed protein product [Paramecium octaurelia]|uniref:Ubiquitin-like protease family profile domain-containing protein n=1 Tax=Paramecium octaurelia TaxID=43137 RepID=A0A8S1X5G4_PAROT|nr:unnamed protein product [Paramecium octaurelia]